MSEEEFKASLDPREIIKRRRTSGSANPSEVSAMLGEMSTELKEFQTLTASGLEAVSAALAKLDSDFESLK